MQIQPLMQFVVSAPSSLQASIQLPASKSISNRALIIHALSRGNSLPTNLSDCDDTQVMIRALAAAPGAEIDILAAGTAMRFLTAYLSVTPGTHVITGTQRMRQRPIRILVDALRRLGADITYVGEEGFPPLRINGRPLQGAEIELAGNISSQYISALLMIGAVLPGGLKLKLAGDIVSRPYIDLTLRLMHDFGAHACWLGEDCILVQPDGYRDVPFTVESDWSAASYWYQMVALSGQASAEAPIPACVQLKGLFAHSYQGDSRGADLFARLGVHTEFTNSGVCLTRQGAPVRHLNANLVDIPDLAQTFVVTCCLLDIPFRFTGLQSLKIKETDRIAALQTELRKLGYVLHDEQDSILSWDGERCPDEPSPVIATYEDHRMAMAFAPASLVLPHIRIADPHVVSKSYPGYWDDLRLVGFRVEECDG